MPSSSPGGIVQSVLEVLGTAPPSSNALLPSLWLSIHRPCVCREREREIVEAAPGVVVCTLRLLFVIRR
jgi:hypothetical protein